MEGQRVPGSLQSIAEWQAKYNGNGRKIAVFETFRPSPERRARAQPM
jgi:hypothetical protein